jgi:anti-sigma factor RsiW
LADLSALADGSLPANRVEEVEARIAQSPGLAELLERETHAVDALRATTASERAPHHLRLEIDALRTARPRRARPRWAPGAAVASAVAAVLAVVLLVSGGAAGPSVAQAAGLALRGSAAAAPAPDSRSPALRLNRAVDEVYFPRWDGTLGWRATGQRADELSGHQAVTVYYRRGAETVAYTILATPPLSEPSGQQSTVAGVHIRSLRVGPRQVITWRRSGRTCVISSANAPLRDLQQLAGWTPANRSA